LVLFKHPCSRRILDAPQLQNTAEGFWHFELCSLCLAASPLGIRNATSITTAPGTLSLFAEEGEVDGFIHTQSCFRIISSIRSEARSGRWSCVSLPLVPRKKGHGCPGGDQGTPAGYSPQVRLHIAGAYQKDAYYRELNNVMIRRVCMPMFVFREGIAIRQLCELYLVRGQTVSVRRRDVRLDPLGNVGRRSTGL